MNTSYWINENKEINNYPRVSKELDTNVAIIGAGLCGITTAFYLSYVDDDIILLEADKIAQGASGRNTGKVTSQHGLLYKTLTENYDKHIARQYYHANEEAIQSIEEIIKKYQIACDFERCDAMLYANDDQNIALLQDEYQAYLDLRIPCEYHEHVNTPFPAQKALIMHYQAKFNPYAYALGLAKVTKEKGVSIYEHSPMKEMIKEEDGTYTLYVNDQKIHANYVIFTTQFPTIDHGHFYFSRMKCEQSTIMYTPYKENVQMAINIDKPMHSYNVLKQTLLIGGDAHKSGQEHEQSLDTLCNDALKTFHLQEKPSYWTSSDYVSFDQIPFVGKLDKHNDHVLFASGFNKWGNTTSNVAAKILCSYVLGIRSPYRMMYSPQRYSSIFSIPFVKENINVAYEFIKGKVSMGSLEYPKRKEGKMMEIDGHTYGAYCDEHDELFIVDITCPHLGCVCTFNDQDKTWDCPCHGSRFSYTGDIIKGPATHKLHRYSEGLNYIDPHILDY